MATTDQYILYDLASQPPCKCWSHNPWKIRMLLNYKKLNYRTVWIEYPDIKPTFENVIEPISSGVPYTIPTITFPSGTTMQDSRTIADKITALHPYPPLPIHDTPYLTRVESIKSQISTTIAPDFLNQVATRLLNPRSASYFRETRAERTGMAIDELEAVHGQGEAIKAVAPLVREVTDMLRGNEGGPFFEGGEVTYVDFVWAGTLRMWERVGSGFLMKILGASEGESEGEDGPGNRRNDEEAEVHLRLLEACRVWMERDDH